MNRSNQHSTDVKKTIAAAGVILLGGCAALVQPVPLREHLAPIDRALTEAPASLAAEAERGDGQAQFALSIVKAHGLNGERRDLVVADRWRRLALTNRQTRPVTQYTAAFNGQPSRVNLIYLPVSALSPAQIAALDGCLVQLAAASSDTPACGDTPAERSGRREAWMRATGGR